MNQNALNAEPLLDVDFALSMWGDLALFQRLLRLTTRSLDGLPARQTLLDLQGEPLEEAGRLLHKYAGRVGVVGMNRLGAALRSVDAAIRAGESFSEPAAVLADVLVATQSEVNQYRLENEVPFVAVVKPEDVDRQALEGLLSVLEGAAQGTVATSALDDAVEDLFDAVGEDPAWAAQDAVNAEDMPALARACGELRESYLT